MTSKSYLKHKCTTGTFQSVKYIILVIINIIIINVLTCKQHFKVAVELTDLFNKL